jgi:hypothetical protein
MSYLPNAQTTYFLDNSTSSSTLGSVVSNAFQRSVFMPCFHNASQTHIASPSVIHLFTRATNDSDANAVLARISLSPSPHASNSQIGASVAHKSSIVMLPNTTLTYQNQPTQITSAILDTGDVVTADNLNVLVLSCGVVS